MVPRGKFGVKQSQLRNFEARLGRSFEQAAYKYEQEGLCDQLRLVLSKHPLVGLPPAAELAGKIEAVRAANTIEAAPERTVRKAVRAERPLTARIMERMVSAGKEVSEALEKPETLPVTPAPTAIALSKTTND